jgi:hypothetical protein
VILGGPIGAPGTWRPAGDPNQAFAPGRRYGAMPANRVPRASMWPLRQASHRFWHRWLDDTL